VLLVITFVKVNYSLLFPQRLPLVTKPIANHFFGVTQLLTQPRHLHSYKKRYTYNIHVLIILPVGRIFFSKYAVSASKAE
jgi:hypothetical protein